jgi:hypothetical protein
MYLSVKRRMGEVVRLHFPTRTRTLSGEGCIRDLSSRRSCASGGIPYGGAQRPAELGARLGSAVI